MDCFVPLMERFHKVYGFYPEYPVADAGYGSYNNYIYCERHGMEKYMKFPMFEKETKDKRYRDNPFRAGNFRIDETGVCVVPITKRSISCSERMCVEMNMEDRKKYMSAKTVQAVPTLPSVKRPIRTGP